MGNMVTTMEANHVHSTTQKSFYVEISRAELVTEDKVALEEQLKVLTGERSAALEALGDANAKAPEAAKAGHGSGDWRGAEHGPGAGEAS